MNRLLCIIAMGVVLCGCATPCRRFRPDPRGPCRPSAFVRVAEYPELNRPYDLGHDGVIEFGYFGTVELAGKTEREAAREIRRVMRQRGVTEATVSVKMGFACYDKISVTGHVRQPGSIGIGAGQAVQLSDALRLAGGLRPTRRDIRVRITPRSAPDNAREHVLIDSGVPAFPDMELRNGDAVHVYEATESSKDSPTKPTSSSEAAPRAAPPAR